MSPNPSKRIGVVETSSLDFKLYDGGPRSVRGLSGASVTLLTWAEQDSELKP